MDQFSIVACDNYKLSLAWFVDLDIQGCSLGRFQSNGELLSVCQTTVQAFQKLWELSVINLRWAKDASKNYVLFS